MLLSHVSSRQLGVKKTERVGHFDNTHPGFPLFLDDLIAKRLHSGPMHLWPKMMFGVVTVVEPRPVIELFVGAHTPGNRLVWIAAVVPIVTVQIREAVAKIPKRKKETDVMPVEDTKDHKSRDEADQFEHSPKCFARVLALQFLKNSFGILAKEAPECVLQDMLRFSVMAMLVN